MTEVWLRGPLEGVLPQLTPAAHALLQSAEDIPPAIQDLTRAQIWLSPGGAASIGFHLQHIAGSLDRLLTYAGGEQLSPEQLAAAKAEREPGSPPRNSAEMSRVALDGITRALDAIRLISPNVLYEPREVGRARLPTTVIGLVFHCAEHTQRHTGQIITTAKIVRGLNLGA